MLRHAIPAVLTFIVIPSCATTTTTPFPGSPTPSAAHLSLSAQDAGKTFTVAIGESVILTLDNTQGVPGSGTRWSAASSNAAVLLVTGTETTTPSAITEVDYPVITSFVAKQRGSADIVATAQATCEAMNPDFCHGPAPLTFHVVVAGSN